MRTSSSNGIWGNQNKHSGEREHAGIARQYALRAATAAILLIVSALVERNGARRSPSIAETAVLQAPVICYTVSGSL
jgi:hypothetical protein